MPDLDVSFMTADPMLSELVTITRRQDAVSTSGRAQKTVEATYPNISAVVTQGDPSDVVRNEDGQLMPRVITVATAFAVRAESKSPAGVRYQPDIITWNGNDYVVIGYAPYPTFGQGVYEVTAQALSTVPVAQ